MSFKTFNQFGQPANDNIPPNPPIAANDNVPEDDISEYHILSPEHFTKKFNHQKVRRHLKKFGPAND